ncbi:DUF3035 domain-containing protein [Roseovarius autotrophicus]|uniref:DUF3035 domain-containing protein n=1 Tax=Roseovarius autotrophicus TaxID=2824121 RepID=UPI001B3611C4|nr:DUF3035 domain-containing protein [Roseovarius autotrophicus]
MWMPRKTVLMLMAAAIVAGCGGRDREVSLAKIRHTGNGPDEFSIIPSKPLEMPSDMAALPAPTPGAPNRTDQNPLADGVAALGGNMAVTQAEAPSAADAGLLAHATRYGRDPAIRQTLAAEDIDVRRSYGQVNIFRILPGDDYVQAYERQWLDAHAEELRLRNRGVRTPASPPAP